MTHDTRVGPLLLLLLLKGDGWWDPDIFSLKHDSRFLRQTSSPVADFSVATISKNTILTTESVVNIVFFEILRNSAKGDHKFMQSLIIQKTIFAFLGCQWSLEMSKEMEGFFEMLATEKSANVYGFSMMEQVRLCAVWPMAFPKPHTGLMNDLNMLLSCYREKMPGGIADRGAKIP